jgi:hypothetical protein
MGASQRVHDLAPDARPPANEAIVAGGVWTEGLRQVRQGARDRNTQKVPLRTRRSFTRAAARGLFGGLGSMAVHFGGGKFIAHDSKLPSLGA